MKVFRQRQTLIGLAALAACLPLSIAIASILAHVQSGALRAFILFCLVVLMGLCVCLFMDERKPRIDENEPSELDGGRS